jgi:hypothetical protein
MKVENQFKCNIFHEAAKHNNTEIIEIIAQKFKSIYNSNFSKILVFLIKRKRFERVHGKSNSI